MYHIGLQPMSLYKKLVPSTSWEVIEFFIARNLLLVTNQVLFILQQM